MEINLTGQVALVTGAGRGIGRGCAEALASAGARVVAVARSEADVTDVANHPSGLIEGWAADVTDDALLERIEAIEGLSILVNNAGGNRPQAFVDVDAESLDFVTNLNVRAAFRVAQSAVRAMIDQGNKGSVIHMSSQMGHVGSPNRTVYCMTKHAIEGLTKAMAVELAPQGIRVNAVAPTFIKTALTEPMLDNAEFREFVYGMIPMKQLGSVDDVTNAVLYLASPMSAMVTGHSLLVDGGWTAR